MRHLPRYLLAWLFMIVYWSAVLALHLLTLKRLPPVWMAAMIRFWGRASLKLLGIRLELITPSTVTSQSPRVVVTNHQSALDLLWGAAICPPAPLAIGKREVIYVPVLNLIWWVLDFVRIDRSNRATSVLALNRAGQKIIEGKRSLMIAPEGTRTPDGTILPFKKGAFHIARRAGVPIHPIIVSGAFELMSKKSLVPKPGVIRLSFLPPVSAQEAGAMADENELIERVRGEMIRVYEQNLKPS
jgi:1-acyl-sn-glycerol-3-phosphate acyltransferase